MIKAQYFKIEELVPPDVFKERGELAWELLDPRALITLDKLRGKFGPLICNDWSSGGAFTERGLRWATSVTGSKYSQHKFGRAFDLTSLKYSAEEMRKRILEYPPDFEFITCLEVDVPWLHFDVRNCEPIKLVRP